MLKLGTSNINGLIYGLKLPGNLRKPRVFLMQFIGAARPWQGQGPRSWLCHWSRVAKLKLTPLWPWQGLMACGPGNQGENQRENQKETVDILLIGGLEDFL